MRAPRAVDLFAGAGGFTAGAIEAGVRVVLAVNHWARSVEIHAANHPDVEHSCQDLQQADFRLFPDHDLLLAAPACQGHSSAGQPARKNGDALDNHQADRNTAWAVVACAEAKRPETILVENVVPFLRWPLYPNWRGCLETLGYQVREHVFDAAEFGVPQNRKRVIISARLDRELRLSSPRRPPRPFGPCVDWKAGDWVTVASRSSNIRGRIRTGFRNGLGPRFLTHYVSGHPGRSLRRPIGTVTTKHQWAAVNSRRMRMLSVKELRRAMSFEEDFILPTSTTKAVRMLGNAIPPVFAKELVRQAVRR